MAEATTRQIDEAADLRGVLLAALGMGEWEAEHLSGLALARRLAALHLAAVDRLAAQSTRMQRLACDVQELLGGEEYERLREELFGIGEEVVRLTAENVRLRGGLLRVLRLADLAADALDEQGIPHYGLGDVARLAREALGDAAPVRRGGVSVTDLATGPLRKALTEEKRRAVAKAVREWRATGKEGV